ncbi:uncharacterized protein HD556DRAFT_1201250, partial [Suillus plorans]
SLKWTRAQLNGGRLTRQRRKASAWNAFVRAKLNRANETRGPGERYRLPAYISAHYAELQQTYARLSESEKKKLRLGIDDLRAMRVNIVRSNPKALLKDVNSTFNTMEKEVFISEATCSWVCIIGEESSRSATQRLPLSKLVSLSRKNIQDGLDNILQKNRLASKKIKMNYENYEKNIVEVYAVAING